MVALADALRFAPLPSIATTDDSHDDRLTSSIAIPEGSSSCAFLQFLLCVLFPSGFVLSGLTLTAPLLPRALSCGHVSSAPSISHQHQISSSQLSTAPFCFFFSLSLLYFTFTTSSPARSLLSFLFAFVLLSSSSSPSPSSFLSLLCTSSSRQGLTSPLLGVFFAFSLLPLVLACGVWFCFLFDRSFPSFPFRGFVLWLAVCLSACLPLRVASSFLIDWLIVMMKKFAH